MAGEQLLLASKTTPRAVLWVGKRTRLQVFAEADEERARAESAWRMLVDLAGPASLLWQQMRDEPARAERTSADALRDRADSTLVKRSGSLLTMSAGVTAMEYRIPE